MFNVIEELKETKKPPKHIADFSLKERKEFANELGIPGFRADQVSRHWFANLNNDLVVGQIFRMKKEIKLQQS